MRLSSRVLAEVRAAVNVRFCTSCQRDRDPAGFVRIKTGRWVCDACNQRRNESQQKRKAA